MDHEAEDESVLNARLAILGLLVASSALARPGVIEFSDGQRVEGNVTLTPGKQIQLLSGGQQRAFGLERVREIRFRPEEELMERNWRFREAGKAEKEFWGDPYPVRHVKASVVFADSTTADGHLFTTVLYVEAKEGTRKVIVYAKQRGEQKQTLAQLVYPTRIRFTDDAADSAARLKLTLKIPGVGSDMEVTGVAIGSLVGLYAHATGKPGEYDMTAPLGEQVAIGYRNGNEIVMGWPAGAAEKITARVREGVQDAQDFFDGKELLGVWHDEVTGNVYSLMLLHRRGHTTMGGGKTQPWRVSIWRWKYDAESNQLMLAGRCDLFREITGRGAALPRVRPSAKLWQPRIENQGVMIDER